MTKADDETKIELLVLKLRASHDQLTHLIKSEPEAALELLEKARNQLYDLVDAYGTVVERVSTSAAREGVRQKA